MVEASSPKSSPQGFTLLEILLVILLISVLLGYGVGFLRRGGNELDQTLVRLQAYARGARMQARFHRSSSRVSLTQVQGEEGSPLTQVLSLHALQPVGEWNFDSGNLGSLGQQGGAGRVVPDGRIGRGLRIEDGAAGHGLYISPRDASEFDLRNGFLLRLDVKLDSYAECQLAVLERVFSLGIDADGKPNASLVLGDLRGGAGRTIRFKCFERVPTQKWLRFVFSFDGETGRLVVDDLQLSERKVGGRMFHDPKAGFLISDGALPVPGTLDEVRLFAFEVLDSWDVPQSVRIEGPSLLVYTKEGLLDRRVHQSPVGFTIRRNEQSETLAIGLGGLVQ
jgi:prepilin-type N-terminal cleavage/methylation domain-containing protein